MSISRRNGYCLLAVLVFSLAGGGLSAEELLLRLRPGVTLGMDENKSLHSNTPELQHILSSAVPADCRLLFALQQEKLPANLRNIYRLRFRSGAPLAALRGRSEVLEAAINQRYRVKTYSDDPRSGEQWYLASLQVPAAWQLQRGDPSVVVGIIDTGIDYRHEDLREAMWINAAEDINGNGLPDSLDNNGIDDDGNGYVDDVVGWDFTDAPAFPDGGDYLQPDNDPMDEFLSGHGTPAAGLIAARQNNGLGISGVAPGVRVMALRAGTASGFLEEDDVAEALLYGIANGCRIINMSFGDPAFSFLLRDVIRYGTGQGVLFVASAGNSGTGEVNYPAGFAETLSVGASDSTDRRAGFSNTGATLDLVAPGVAVLATQTNNGYGPFNGTSFSAPLVCAALALIWSHYPDYTAAEVRGTLLATCRDAGLPGWDERFGHGIPDVLRSLQRGARGYAAISYPAAGGGVAGTGDVAVTGSVSGAGLQGYRLSYGTGEDPAAWELLASGDNSRILNDTLGLWSAAALPDGLYSLELRVQLRDAADLVVRRLVTLDRTAPQVTRLLDIPLLAGASAARLLEFHSDDETRALLRIYNGTGSDPLLQPGSAYRRNEHRFVLYAQDLPSQPRYTLELTNASGLVTLDDNAGAGYAIPLESLDYLESIVTRRALLPFAGYLLPDVVDFNNNGLPELLFSRLEADAFAETQIREYHNGTFDLLFSDTQPGIPRAAAQLRSSGGLDLALGLGRKSRILGNAAANAFPVNEVWADTANFWISRFFDSNADGKNEILALKNGRWRLFGTDETYQLRELQSLPLAGEGSNAFGVPWALSGDFDGDNATDIAVCDLDGDLVIYEAASDGLFRDVWSVSLPGKGGESLLARTDMDGDGLPELAVAVRNQPGVLLESNVNSKFWALTLWKAQGDNTYQQVARRNILGVSSGSGTFNGLSSGDLDGDGRDELIFLPYPQLYVFSWQQDSLQVRWQRDGVNSNTALVADFDGNGAADLLYNGSGGLEHWEGRQSGVRPLPPANLQAVALDSSRIRLSWHPVDGVQWYRIYRDTSGALPQFLDSIVGTEYTDSALQSGQLYRYHLTSWVPQLPQPESLPGPPVSATPALPPRVDSIAVASPRQLRVFYNEEMQAAAFLTTAYALLPQQQPPRSVARERAGRQALLSFEGGFNTGENELFISRVPNAAGIPLENSRIVKFQFTESIPLLYLTSVQYLSKTQLRLLFNLPLEPGPAGDTGNYRLAPGDDILNATLENERTVLLELRGRNRMGSLGESYTLSVSGLTGLAGNPLAADGRTAGVVQDVPGLQEMLVYPNPFRRSDAIASVRFANMPPQSELFIYNLSGTLIRHLAEANAFGALEWDLRTTAGDNAASGVYVYLARYRDQEKMGKFVIVQD